MVGHLKKEHTLVIIKPDGVQRALMGEIIRRYERTGLKLVALKMTIPTSEMARTHYMVGGEEWLENIGRKAAVAYEKKGKKSPFATFRENGVAILEANAKYLSSGPVVAMIWEGHQAVGIVRKITGGTDQRSIRNLIHASGTPEEAEKEIPIWFEEKEILKYRLIAEQILYDVNLDGILE